MTSNTWSDSFWVKLIFSNFSPNAAADLLAAVISLVWVLTSR
jgi:hypothetical protein